MTTDLQLTRILHKAMRQCPADRAIHFDGQDFSYREFVGRVTRLAAVFRDLGVRPGDRIGILALNSHRYVEYFFATWWAGGVINPVNIRWSVPEIAYSLDDCDTRILLVDDAFSPLLEGIRARSRSLATVLYMGDGPAPGGLPHYERLLAAGSPSSSPIPDQARQGDDVAAVMYTGGTTGQPKGVMLSHRNLMSGLLGSLIAMPRPRPAVGIVPAPIFHVGGAMAVVQSMHGLGAIVMLPGFDPLAVMQAIQNHRGTDIFLVPTMLARVLDHPRFDEFDLRSLRLLVYGASPISEAVLQRAMSAFPNARFYQAYGMTECSPTVAVLPHDAHVGDSARLRAAGLPVITTEVRIADADGADVPAGQVGELLARGPTVMLGYWNKPRETAAALRDGWMHTGDSAWQDGEGYLYVVDRVKDMIVTGGENVYSAEVENALAQMPQVLMSAVIGVPDEQYGERVHAVVVPRPGHALDADEVIAHCKSLIAGYKCPRSVEFRAELPMTPVGKLQKFQLREPYWKGRTRQVN